MKNVNHNRIMPANVSDMIGSSAESPLKVILAMVPFRSCNSRSGNVKDCTELNKFLC